MTNPKVIARNNTFGQSIRTPTTRKLRSAFSLMEILAVVAILAILIALVVPTIGKMQVSAQKAESIARMKSCYQLIQAWTADNDGRLMVGYSTQKIPGTNKTYGTWTHRLNQDGYIQPPVDSVMKYELFGCPRQLAQFPPPSRDVRTYAMNNHLGDINSPDPRGARRLARVAKPSKTALLLSGPFNGTRFSTNVLQDYHSRMLWDGEPYTPFSGSVLVLFLDGHVDVRALDTIPTSSIDGDPQGGFDFWLGGARG